MEFSIAYFSGTGNTEIISRALQKNLEEKGQEVELVSIEDEEKIVSLIHSDRILGFGFPVYKFSYPDILNRLFPFFNNPAPGRPYFQFSTYARFPASSLSDFSRRMGKTGLKLIAEESFKAPSCGISARKAESDYVYASVMFFEDHIQQKIDAFGDRILSAVQGESKGIEHRRPLLGKAKSKLVTRIEQTKYPLLQINENACSLCGLCAAHCPDHNLTCRAEQIEIKDQEHCLHCLRCMNHCPSNALSFGALSRGENRYTLKHRDQLYQKALSGYEEKYWNNFDKVVKQWRKDTLKYWWTHRKNPEL